MVRKRGTNFRPESPDEYQVFVNGERVKPDDRVFGSKRGREPEDGDTALWSVEEDERWLREIGALE